MMREQKSDAKRLTHFAYARTHSCTWARGHVGKDPNPMPMRFTAVCVAFLSHSHHIDHTAAYRIPYCFQRYQLFPKRPFATSTKLTMTTVSRKDLIRKLLKGIETGDPEAAAVVSEDRYIQHNPQTKEGGEGLAALFQRLSKTNPRVNIVRAFEDGDYVFAHTEYDFSTRRIGFEVFRFDGNHAVEHWDNIQPRKGPNPSGHSMVDGVTEATDLEKTEANRAFVRRFVQTVLVDKSVDKIGDYIDGNNYTQHNPMIGDGIGDELKDAFKVITYDTIHRVLAEGNFVLTVSEGSMEGVHTSFYDLFRVESGMIVEHWDTIETVPPVSEWKNQNGKF